MTLISSSSIFGLVRCGGSSAASIVVRNAGNNCGKRWKCIEALKLREGWRLSQMTKILSLKQSNKVLPSSYFLGTNFYQIRSVHSGANDDKERDQSSKRSLALPSLMDFPRMMWPKLANTIRNWFFTYFVIRPYFDNDFTIKEFMQGAHEAISLVSTKLSTGQLDDLEGLVDPLVLLELKKSISSFSVFQQDLLRVAVEDIYFSFPYQIGVIIPDRPTLADAKAQIEKGMHPQTRHVEITVVLHVLRGMEEMKTKAKESGEGGFQIIDLTKDEENKYKVMVCNYRFFRDFTSGCKDPSWIINMVNHFLPVDLNHRVNE